jgi:signal transduction histidine kinase
MEKIPHTTKFAPLILAVQQLSLARDLGTVMKIVKRASREIAGSDGTTFVLREGNYCFYADEAAIAPLFKGMRFPLEQCISGWSMLHQQQVVIEDIYADARIPHEVYRPTFVKSLVMVPIRTIDPIGAIGSYWAGNHTPGEEEITTLQALADITAVSLENIKVYAELDRRVKQRTRELEEMNRELEAFSYSVSHDLRAPLRAINGYMEMLVEDHTTELSPEAKRLAGRVLENAQGMAGLINSLLTFFKMGKNELEKTVVNMADMVPDICNNLKEHEKGRDIRISIKELPPVSADSALIKQVWQNLISNAVKYTGNRPQALIEIGAETKDEKVNYYIKDNGAGFDMNYYSKLFGVFQRLHSQREFEGSGIGLATVEKIIKKHGGRVWANSKINEGSTFYFTLD